MTRLPLPQRISSFEAIQIVQRFSQRFKTVALTPTEYMAAMRSLAERGMAGAIVYDALLVACARKIDASEICTLNLKHFRLVAPDLAARIVAP